MKRSYAGPLVLIVVAALVACAAGCGTPRDVSTPRKALLGHWKNIVPGSTTELYYNKGSVIFSGKRKEFSLPYRVLEESKPSATLVIRLTAEQAGVALTDRVVFSHDKRTIDVFRDGMRGRLQFSYLDERQAPEGYLTRQPTAVTARDRGVP